MKGKGIQLNNDYDLFIKPQRDASGKITTGLQIGDTLYQNQALILAFHPGELKLNPIVGVGLSDIINDNDFLGMRRKIRQQMELDDQQVTSIKFSTKEDLKINAQYSNS